MNYKKMTPDEIADEIISLATEEGKTKLNGDYRRGNRLTKRINKLLDPIKEDPEVFKFGLKRIMKADERRARGMGAALALQNDIEELVDEAEQILEETSKFRDILGFSSGMALSIWRGEMSGDPNTWKKRKDTSEK